MARKKPSAEPADSASGKGAVTGGDEAAGSAAEQGAALSGPSPNPLTNLVMADIALRGGGRLLRHVVERGLLGTAYAAGKAGKIVKGRGMAQTLISTALARVATRSVPGAIIVGGGMLAKTLYDRRKGAARARAEGAAAVERQAAKGGED